MEKIKEGKSLPCKGGKALILRLAPQGATRHTRLNSIPFFINFSEKVNQHDLKMLEEFKMKNEFSEILQVQNEILDEFNISHPRYLVSIPHKGILTWAGKNIKLNIKDNKGLIEVWCGNTMTEEIPCPKGFYKLGLHNESPIEFLEKIILSRKVLEEMEISDTISPELSRNLKEIGICYKQYPDLEMDGNMKEIIISQVKHWGIENPKKHWRTLVFSSLEQYQEAEERRLLAVNTVLSIVEERKAIARFELNEGDCNE